MSPFEIFFVWEGGVSFRGVLLGVAAAVVIFARGHQLKVLPLIDLVACAAPIGLFFGRFANFINGDLYGCATEAPWAMAFPGGGPEPRHPSQLYEAALDGLLLFLVLLVLARRPSIRARRRPSHRDLSRQLRHARVFVKLFREPDAFLAYPAGGITMGQILSVPLILRLGAARPGGVPARN